MGWSIVFVDDDPGVLEGLQRMLRSMRREWRMHFFPSAAQALAFLESEPVDVVVSDMRMPGVDGAEFLAQVKRAYPHVIRIALSGYADQEMVLRAVRSAHQYLAKPCSAETLKGAIDRVRALRELLEEESLRAVVADLEVLPSLLSLYQDIMKELESQEASVKRVGEIIAKDVGMTAKILQLVNSAFFGVSRHVSNPAQAAVLLGLDTIRALVLSLHIFSQFKGKAFSEKDVSLLWEHSLTTAVYAKTIASAFGADRMVCEDAFMAGMLHDVGKLIFIQNLPEKTKQAVERSTQTVEPLWASEKAVVGTSHGEVGAYLMGVWGLPDSIVEALAFHHFPSRCPHRQFSALTAVHVADFLHYAASGGPSFQGPGLVDQAYLSDLGVLGQLRPWKEACQRAIAAQ
ncbi:MAG: response regulator [Desulfosoma sp.]